ncbi:PHP domain-containing protein [Tundrisphaera sp. TA3]|uniref:PHP domain-containing protein n=1 Tax=Tundrisphaera sp. TA3 TaxID=3435775 RepID=UPI003EC0C6D9
MPARRPGPARPASPRASVADLHVHTTHSDGVCSPGEIVRAAAAVGLGAVAITDHDTLSAIAVARPEADRVGVELIAGIELTAEREGREIHILGHFVRDDDPGLGAEADRLRVARRDRIEAMAGRLAGLGVAVDLDQLRSMFPRATLGRKHLADWLARTRQVESSREAFARFLGDGGPAQVPKPRVAWDRAIDLIRGAGGVAGLAHPPYDLREIDLRSMAEAGLGSIEVDGPGINTRLGRRWRDHAGRMDLVPIAGTDFHAPDRPGRWVGAITTSAIELASLRDRASALAAP